MPMPRKNDNYREPLNLLNEVEEENEKIPKEVFFNDPGHQKDTEKWCASVFGLGYSQYCKKCVVKVNDSKRDMSPDFFLKVNSQVFEFEITEVQKEGRKRGKYFKDLKNNLYLTEEYKPEHCRQEGPRWIYEAIKRKASKCYENSGNLNILVYANLDTENLDRNGILSRSEEFSGTFASIWIITNLQICSIFSNDILGKIDDFKEITELKNRILDGYGLRPAHANNQ
jgi:hypothetical protein